MLGVIAYSQGCSSNYVVPNFQLQQTDPACGPNSGVIQVVNLQDGVAPFTFRLIELNITNSTGLFTGLAAGDYRVELRDACGTVRTRQVTLVPYTAFSFTYSIAPTSGTCKEGDITITTSPVQGNYVYGVVMQGSTDTTWSNTPQFHLLQMTKRITIVVKDNCGNMVTDIWIAPQQFFPYIKEIEYKLGCFGWDLYPVYYGFFNPTVCLYKSDGTLVQCKSAPGDYNGGGALTNFFDLPYGDYYFIIQDACFRDSMFMASLESVDGSQMNPYNWDCTTFSMNVEGPQPSALWYSQHPEASWGHPDSICLFDLTRNKKVGCKPPTDHLNWINPRTGLPWLSGAVWDNLPYGKYRAYTLDPCSDSVFLLDTTVQYPNGFDAAIGFNCEINRTPLSVSFKPEAKAPYNIKLYYPDGSLALNTTTNNYNGYFLYNTWPYPGTLTVIASDGCGFSDTSTIYQGQIYPKRDIEVKAGCPGVSGSAGGNILLKGNPEAYGGGSQTGAASVTIIKINGNTQSIPFDSRSVNSTTGKIEYLFTNLTDTGTYIIESSVGCYGFKVYDTIEIRPYAYPQQVPPNIVQCGNNPYTFKDSVVNGVGPFTFEILGTRPAYASVLTGPQLSNIFNIPAGVNLDSITLKALDYCGNSNIKTFPVLRLADCQALDVIEDLRNTRINDQLIKVYPNPSQGRFIVSFSKKRKTDYNITITNALGILVYQTKLADVDKKQFIINERLTKGMYVITIADLRLGNKVMFKHIVL